MSEAAARPRQPVDLGEFERRLRGPDNARAHHEDPLTELARLVEGGQDPFAGAFRNPSAAPAPSRAPEVMPEAPYPAAAEAHFAADPGPVHQSPVPKLPGAGTEHEAWMRDLMDARRAEAELAGHQHPLEPADLPAAHQHAAEAEAAVFSEFAGHRAQHQLHAEPKTGRVSDVPAHETQAQAPPAEGAYHHGYSNEGQAEAWPDEVDHLPPPPLMEPPRSRARLYAMGGALALVVAGIGGTFALKSGPAGQGEAPMIKAAAGPAKVPNETVAAAGAPAASVLDKTGDKLAVSRVTGTVEQPVDVARTARPAAPAAANGIFPEPRKVKTVSVRPDGSIIGSDIPVSSTPPAAVAAVPAPPPRPAAIAAAPVASAPKPAPAAPKATIRVATRTPVADDPDAPVTRTVTAKPAPKPAQKAATETQPAAGGGGGFAVQLGSAGSDAEARDKATRLQTQLSSTLEGRRAVVTKGDVNGKTVYRVRIVGLTQENASALCSKVKGGGGDCFVAR